MSVVDLHPEDLLEKDARGALDDAERARLEVHVARCAACRFERQARLDFAAELDAELPPGKYADLVENLTLMREAPADVPVAPLAAAEERDEAIVEAPIASEERRVAPLVGPRDRARRKLGVRAAWLLAAAAVFAVSVAGATGVGARAWSRLVGTPAVTEEGSDTLVAPTTAPKGAPRAASRAPQIPAIPPAGAESPAESEVSPTPEASPVAPTSAPNANPSAPLANAAAKDGRAVLANGGRAGISANGAHGFVANGAYGNGARDRANGTRASNAVANAASANGGNIANGGNAANAMPVNVEAPAPERDQAASSVGSAAALFDQANEARRRGDYGRTLAMYRDLEARFPRAREAQVSRATAGRLLLDRGDASGALARFDAYLAAGGGELREETMAGRATALERMGRADDARRAWTALLAAFPSTPYAAHAKARLGALDGR